MIENRSELGKGVSASIEETTENIPKGEAEETEKLENIPPEEQAEQLWGLWRDYRRSWHDYYKDRKRKLEKPELEKSRTEFNDQPKIRRIKTAIAQRWQNPQVQSLFKHHLAESIKEQRKIKPTWRSYKNQAKQLAKQEGEQQQLFQELFVHRDEEPDELSQIELARFSAEIEVARFQQKKVFQENPELAGRVQYEKLTDYHAQFEKGGFIWAPSRERFFDKIMEHLVLLDRNRPMLLEGDTGVGKTQLIRATVARLTGRPPFEVGEEAKNDIRSLLGSISMKGDETYISYGPLGQALTGKKTSLDKTSDGGGIFYMDEMNGYPPDGLRALIKQISGRSAGEEVTFAAWHGKREKIAPKSGFVGAANLPSEKHPDRAELPVEVTRELTFLEISYPEQTADNPELYEMMLAVLMDKNGRIRLKEGELEPAWQENVDPNTQEKTLILDPNPEVGGTLWRFANLVVEIQKSYQGKENLLTPNQGEASYLQTAVLDPGRILTWLREYRISGRRQDISLEEFLKDKLSNWSAQRAFPEEDRELIGQLRAKFGLGDEDREEVGKTKIWSEKELGLLSPRVPRPKESVVELEPEQAVIILEDGTEMLYQPAQRRNCLIGGDSYQVIGQTGEGEHVLRNPEGEHILYSEDQLVEARINELVGIVSQNPDEREDIVRNIEVNYPKGEATKIKVAVEKEDWDRLKKLLISNHDSIR
jgi:hypothetical protein